MFKFLAKYKKGLIVGTAIVLTAILTSLLGFQAILYKNNEGLSKLEFVIGTTASASTTADATCDGTADDVQWQAQMNLLPATGGQLTGLGGTYDFDANVTRAIAAITIDGVGYGTYITRDGVNPPITAGGNNWVIKDCRFDIAPSMGATTGWVWENVWIGATHYAYYSADDVTGASWQIPTGRGATLVVAGSNASTSVLAEADYVCDGVADNVQIQAAITALPARTSIATVKCVGAFSTSAVITLSDYTRLDLTEATITLAANTNNSVIENSAPGGGNTDIVVIGGEIDGNKANQVGVGGNHGIFLDNVTRAWITDVYVHDTRNHAIYIDDNDETYIIGVKAEDAGVAGVTTGWGIAGGGSVTKLVIANSLASGCADTGITVQPSSGAVSITNSISHTNGGDGFASGNVTGATDVVFSGNISYSNTGDGIEIADSTKSFSITGNICYSNTMNGILVNSTVEEGMFGTVTGNTVHNNGRNGLWWATADRGVINSNVSYDNGQGNTAGHENGIKIGTCLDIVITSNNAFDTQAPKTQEYGIWVATGAAAISRVIIRNNDTYGNNAEGVYNTNNTNASIAYDQMPLSVEMDLSNAAEDFDVWYAETSSVICGYKVLWTEAAGDANTCTVRVGRRDTAGTLDEDYFDSSVTAGSEALYATTVFDSLDMTQVVVAQGVMITVGHTQKGGGGKVKLILFIAEMAD